MFYQKRQVGSTAPEMANGPRSYVSGPRVPANMSHPLLYQQQTIGNQALGRILQAHFRVSRPDDAHEREANQVAEQIASSAASQGEVTALNNDSKHQGGKGGRPLSAAMRAYFEPRLGRDLSHIRLHTDIAAGESAQALNALAYTIGQNIVFAAGHYAPETQKGQSLLAHELVHTIQQSKMGNAAGLIQRQENGPITAKTIFPYKAGTRLTLNHLLNDFLLTLISKQSPDLAQALGAMVERRATVTVATDDVFEALIQAEPATADRPARSSLGLRLERAGETFTLQFFSVNAAGERTVMQQIPDLKARRHEGGTALAGTIAGQKVDLGVQPGKKPGQFTLGALSPLSLDVLDIQTLASARAGSAEEQAEVKKAAASTSGARTVPRQRLQLGVGGLWVGSDPVVGILGTSWQLNLKPTNQWWGTLTQIPIEIQFQYAPGPAVLAALNSGLEASLPGVVPVNVRIITGLGGGWATREGETGTPERQYLFGPTVGAGVGLEKSWFRMDLRYEHLFNLLENGPSTNALFLRLGIAP